MNELKFYLDLYKHGKFKEINETMMEVENHNVKKQLKKGRTIFLCDCENSGRFENIQTCRHIEFFILFPFLNKFFSKIESLQDEYKAGESATSDEKVKRICFQIYEDLKNLEELR